MKIPGKIVVWPAYLDSRKPWSKGRRVPRRIAVEAPKTGELAEAAKKLGLEPEIVEKAALPHTWWEKTGYILIIKKGKNKIELFRDIATQVSSMRKITPQKTKRR